jgi:hypothetical protein
MRLIAIALLSVVLPVMTVPSHAKRCTVTVVLTDHAGNQQPKTQQSAFSLGRRRPRLDFVCQPSAKRTTSPAQRNRPCDRQCIVADGSGTLSLVRAFSLPSSRRAAALAAESRFRFGAAR